MSRTELELASRFGTFGGGADGDRVPPVGVPEFLGCENAGLGLSCQDLNGDQAAPIGGGVYVAEPASDWRRAPVRRRQPGLPPGIRFTPAEYRVLMDLASGLTTSSSSSHGQGHLAPRVAPRRSR